MINKLDMEWFRKEHLRIIDSILDEVRHDPKLKALILRPSADVDPATRHEDPAEWEDWLKDANRDGFFTLKRLRFQANEIWASGSADQVDREKFTAAVETEYRLSIWAAREYLKAVQSLELGVRSESKIASPEERAGWNIKYERQVLDIGN